MSTDAWKALIDKGSAICGSQGKLAIHIGTTKQELSNAKHGRRAMPAAVIEQLAKVIGEPVQMVGSLHDLARTNALSKYQAGLGEAAAVFFSTQGNGAAIGERPLRRGDIPTRVSRKTAGGVQSELFALMARGHRRSRAKA
jgi:plasmid maintenance system antidote protein VapI